jgi:predicted ATPase/DNA-binding CsgD family transcriptional regulator
VREQLIGRSRELAAAAHLLRQQHVRLLTFSGAGGVGKTRLAYQVADELANDFDRICFVSLAPIRDHAHFVAALAQALDLYDAGDHNVLERITAQLRPLSHLLVLDNFEHILKAAPLLADLLAACPALKLLVTSRASLRLRSEYEFPVPPLAVDDAMTLFAQRAQQHRPNFALTPHNSEAVRELCVRLDGLPLALELAAVRIKLLSPQAILARLDERLNLLTGGPTDAPARQQTLRSAIAWSYDLLTPAQRHAFRRLAVFVGGWTLEAAEAVLRTEGRGQSEEFPISVLSPQSSVLDELESLINNSLVRQVDRSDGEPRFTMLETIREYGLEQLVACGEQDSARRAHADVCLSLAERAEPYLAGEDQRQWLDRLDEEHNNLRAALAWSLQEWKIENVELRRSSDWLGEQFSIFNSQFAILQEIGLRLAGALWRFWYARSHLREGLSWLEAALALPNTQADPARLKALHGAALFATTLTRLDDAERYCRAALALARRAADPAAIAAVLQPLAVILAWRGRYDEARAISAESVELGRSTGDPVDLALALGYQGHVGFFSGDYDPARQSLRAALTTFQACNHIWGIAFASYGAGLVELADRNIQGARPLLETALDLDGGIGNRRGMIRSLFGLGRLAHIHHDFALARARLRESLELSLEIGDAWSMCRCLEALADLMLATGQPDDAARLFAMAEAQREALGAPLPVPMASWYAHIPHELQRRVDAPTLTACLAEGRVLNAEWVLRRLDAPMSERADPVAPIAALVEPLTPREIDVLRLLARGLTDQQIAATLVISPRTVHTHLNAIYGKLGVSNRSAATRWALEHGIG